MLTGIERSSGEPETLAHPIVNKTLFGTQGRIKHVGMFLELEEQMCSYVPGQYDGSPDRMDALVWAISEFLEPEVVTTRVYYEDRVRISPY
jgi:phage terminase large subunit-like protein